MPWKELSRVNQRETFVSACLAESETMTDLCRRFEISRKTGDKWLGRFLATSQLEDLSRRPKSSPHKLANELEEAIVSWRKRIRAGGRASFAMR